MTQTMTGGCQCGRVRYAVEISSDAAGLCHCRKCQKATGGFAAAVVDVPVSAVRWQSEPDWYASSPVARRAFCSRCGTPLGFMWADGAGSMDLTIGSFDDPTRFKPVAHGGAESMLEAWLDTSALPRKQTGEIASTVARWKAAGLEVPE